MIVTDLSAISANAEGKGAVALASLTTGVDAVFAASQAVLGHMVRVSEALDGGHLGPGTDFDALMLEFLGAARLAVVVQNALTRALLDLHKANMAASASDTLELLQAEELAPEAGVFD